MVGRRPTDTMSACRVPLAAVIRCVPAEPVRYSWRERSARNRSSTATPFVFSGFSSTDFS